MYSFYIITCFLGVMYGSVWEFIGDFYDTCHVLTYVVEQCFGC